MCHSHVIPISFHSHHMKVHLKSVTVARLKAMMTEKKVSSVVAGVMSDRPTPNWAKAQFLDSDVFRKSAGDAGGCLLTSCDIRKKPHWKIVKNTAYTTIYTIYIYCKLKIIIVEYLMLVFKWRRSCNSRCCKVLRSISTEHSPKRNYTI